MKATDYPRLVIWSEEDQAYLVHVVDLAGCMADGATLADAIQNSDAVIQHWLETAQELGREIPAPADEQEFNRRLQAAMEDERSQFEKAVQATAKEMVDRLLPEIVERFLRQREREVERRPSTFIFGPSTRKLVLSHSG
jgi:predicted RNase H-like HicB family nuclease